AQGQWRDGPYLARGARDRADPPAYGGPGLRPAAALVPRRHDARIRLHPTERSPALGAADRGRGSAARDESGGWHVRSALAPGRHGTDRDQRRQVARRPRDRPPQRRLPDRRADLDRSPLAPLGRLARGEAAAPVSRDPGWERQ